MDTQDLVLAQLRKLREGPGLRLSRLEPSGAVMSALGTSDVGEGYERLIGELSALGDSPEFAALEVDFGLHLDRHLRREPTEGEVRLLGQRRAGFGQTVGRDVKTLSRWSDRAVAELRNHLIRDEFNGHLVVVAAVKGERVLGFTLSRNRDLQEFGQTGESEHVDNPSTEPSPPCFVYGYPRDWHPATLTLAVSFLKEPYPTEVWAAVADSFFGAVFGEERYSLPLNQGIALCRIQSPRRDRLYAICWR